MKSFSNRLEAIEPSKIKIDSSALKDPEVISLSIGEPDFTTPWSFRQAGIEAIQEGYTFYADGMGLPALRKGIAEYLKHNYSLSYDPRGEILVTVGASQAIDLALRALLNDGDEVIIPEPAYPSYAPMVELCGGVVKFVPLYADDGFVLDPVRLEKAITPKTKALIINYPHNPTGAVLDEEAAKKIADVIIKHDLYLITDEIYSALSYEGKHFSIASIDGIKERCIYINGFSKAFAMTGWRLGYVASSKDIVSRMMKINQYSMLSAPTISEFAGYSAITSDGTDTKKMRDAYNLRRVYLIGALKDMGLDCYTPQGAFYVFPSISKFNISSDEFVSRLLKDKKLLLISGSAFGAVGEGYVRISYAYSIEKLKEGMKRLQEFIATLSADSK
ncbi:MAG: pyridoxal phosphate-dependent aminotransferase [Bacilli bacterium]|jgi:aminotransferase|nr:pyridoxal phosphate-dependent aminotransferase [Bacilli bacterium]